jgi:hypothetical protein
MKTKSYRLDTPSDVTFATVIVVAFAYAGRTMT